MLDQTSQQPLSIIFTLRTYTHATRQNQDEAAQTMGEISWASHVSRKRTQKYRREGKTSSPVLFKPIRTFPRVGHGVGQCLTHILTHTVFSVFATKKASKTEVFDAFWSCWADSNCRPHPYQGCALPTELQQQMATRKGFEPSTSGVTGRRSNQLNYLAIYLPLRSDKE